MADERPENGVGLAAGPASGARIAGYRLERQIGAGGMAVVYLAWDERLGRPVALKVMTPAMAADETFRRRFIRESRAAAAVDDPHIIPVYEAGEADGVLFIAIRFVSGGDVGSLLQGTGGLPPDQVVSVISPVASALDAAHAAGLVHRDVKPANMLLDSRPGRPDHVYLSDFGLSQFRRSDRLTGSGHFMGTPHYTAPEQIAGQQVDGRADQYALACSAFEMLAGDVPFDAQESWAVVSAQMNNPPPALSERRSGLPPAVDRVLARAMAKRPDDRYGSCRQFADALGDALGQAGGRPSVARRPRRRRQAYAPAVLTASVVLAAAAVAASVLVSPGNRSAAPALYTRIRAFTAPRPAGLAPFVSSVAFSPDGQTLATGTSAGPGSPGSTDLWDVRTGKRLLAMSSAGGAEAFSPDGRQLAVADGPGGSHLSVWNAVTGTWKRGGSVTPALFGAVRSAAFSPDGKVLAASLSSDMVFLWSTARWRDLRLVGGFASPTTSVAFTPDSRTLVTGGNDGRVFLWSWVTGHRTGVLKCPGHGLITAVAVSPSGQVIAASDQDGGTCLWDTATRTVAATLTDPRSDGIDTVAFSPDGRMLATGDRDGRTYLWHLPTGTPTATLVSPRGPVGPELAGDARTAVFSVAFSPDGKTLATSDTDGSAYLWRVR